MSVSALGPGSCSFLPNSPVTCAPPTDRPLLLLSLLPARSIAAGSDSAMCATSERAYGRPARRNSWRRPCTYSKIWTGRRSRTWTWMGSYPSNYHVTTHIPYHDGITRRAVRPNVTYCTKRLFSMLHSTAYKSISYHPSPRRSQHPISAMLPCSLRRTSAYRPSPIAIARIQEDQLNPSPLATSSVTVRPFFAMPHTAPRSPIPLCHITPSRLSSHIIVIAHCTYCSPLLCSAVTRIPRMPDGVFAMLSDQTALSQPGDSRKVNTRNAQNEWQRCTGRRFSTMSRPGALASGPRFAASKAFCSREGARKSRTGDPVIASRNVAEDGAPHCLLPEVVMGPHPPRTSCVVFPRRLGRASVDRGVQSRQALFRIRGREDRQPT
ncbi:hypothetical protein C8Q80DRAFT_879225 [Daedaleopsis nitida]|nr:hypothetical protein C8Q80DRAFT_879225 [Daedaleopsis nitida]